MEIGSSKLHYLRPKDKGIRLHLGCGDYWREGALNIDHAVLGGTDMILDLREKLPFQDSVVELIESYEFVEHFTNSELDKMLTDWYRVLIEGGQVISVVPDIEELMKLGLIIQIYGIEQDHKWGYTKESLEELFEVHNFKNIQIEKKYFDHRPGEPKLELRCMK